MTVGEVLALMGPNGCGKTTLLRVLATVSRPQQGVVRWAGGDALGMRTSLGLALDGALEEPALSGRQSTVFWCSQWVEDRGDCERRSHVMLHRLGLTEVADEPVAAYSFGMRRRLALAAALVHEPRLAALDEPTAGLDPEGVELLVTVLRERSWRGLGTLVASNDPAFVESVAGRVAFLDEGRLVRCASPAELLAALPPGRLAELVTSSPLQERELRRIEGVTGADVDGCRARVRLRGDAAVAALVAAADAPGGQLRELRLRSPDLSDCFRSLTGRPLQDVS